MKLTDIQPIEKWIEFEEQIYAVSGLNPTIYDTEGVSITQTTRWVNDLCPEIKSVSKGQTFICSAAHQNIASEAEASGDAVVDECDAGLLKIVVPIFVKDEFVGAAGGCGLILADGEVESFLVNKTIDMDEDKVENLAEGITVLSEEKANEVAGLIKDKIQQIVADYTG